jgi:hypothetical protein
MLALISTACSWLACRIRSRAELEPELIVLRDQVAVLNRQRSGRLRLCSIDRLLWVWLYMLWPRCLDAMVLVKPATVVQWHRRGFRLYWRWRSRSGCKPVDRETRKLIRQMCLANRSGARIHGELLKLGIKISQATVAKYTLHRRHSPSPTWRGPLRDRALHRCHRHVCRAVGHLPTLVRNAHPGSRPRKIVRFDVTQHPTAGWLSRQVTEAFPWDTAPRFLVRDRDPSYGEVSSKRVEAMSITGS